MESGLRCPVYDTEIAASFNEIFFHGEYEKLLELIPIPQRWVDLGCYAGFFSLWLENRRLLQKAPGESHALLLDANRAMALWPSRIIELNGLGSRWRQRCAAIAGGSGDCEYVERSYMGSSLKSIDSKPGHSISVPILTDSEFGGVMPAPYDLVKVDMEGAEFELLSHYPRLLSQTRYLCLEWHSWHAGGGGAAQIQKLVENSGFRLVEELQPARNLRDGGATGVWLFINSNLGISVDGEA